MASFSSSSLSLHDALPIFDPALRAEDAGPLGPLLLRRLRRFGRVDGDSFGWAAHLLRQRLRIVTRFADPLTELRRAFDDRVGEDRKSTRLNSSHLGISYAV